ncbi:hypothetical protein HYW20_05235 [Candidatus Woesearchaeota archaeon]|nr:hypothetical protein [Candidatus Woesearchaeota archaeon]
MKKHIIFFLIFIFSIGFVFADAEEFAEAKKLIDAKTPCFKLTESQLEIIGDYLMEQMHPGQAHEAMDKMMGGEGSQSLRLMHIAMAKRIYCNDFNSSASYGMMGYGMMGTGLNTKANYGGMMTMMGGNFGYGMMGSGYGMMGNVGYGYLGFINFLSLVLVIGLIILVYLWIIKLWKGVFKKR